MKDLYRREIDYMRISITDRCDLRCKYCMPEGCQWIPMEEILTYEEIVDVCREAAALGIRKIKITGGEPLVRKGCPALIRMLKAVSGIEQVTLTTNGTQLAKYAGELKEAGVDGINVSLDSLDEMKYKDITGFGKLSSVLQGIEAALALGLKVKTNTVLQPGTCQEDWEAMAELARERPLDVRFIEMMPIGSGKDSGNISQTISNQEVLESLKETYGMLKKDISCHGNGPAVYYRIPGFAGSVGFISAVHGRFCSGCNRIRMTAKGEVKPCLCYGDSFSVREALRSGDAAGVRKILEEAIAAKPKEHCFQDEEQITEEKKMAQIGG